MRMSSWWGWQRSWSSSWQDPSFSQLCRYSGSEGSGLSAVNPAANNFHIFTSCNCKSYLLCLSSPYYSTVILETRAGGGNNRCEQRYRDERNAFSCAESLLLRDGRTGGRRRSIRCVHVIINWMFHVDSLLELGVSAESICGLFRKWVLWGNRESPCRQC